MRPQVRNRDYRHISIIGFRLTRNALLKRIEDRVVFVHTQTGQMHVLSPTASYIWKLAFEGKSRSEIEILILREFEVSPAQLSEEIQQLFASLMDEGLIEQAE